MRLFFIFVVTAALGQTAMAQTSECKSVADPAARLACYDRTASPTAAPPTVVSPKAKPVAHAAPSPNLDNTKYVDSISAEDAVMNERIKGICRGC